LNWPRANKDNIRVNTVLGEETLFLRDSEWSLPGVHSGKRDDNFGNRSRSVYLNPMLKRDDRGKHSGGQNTDPVTGHMSPP
jgi:hypothetical protein